MSESRDRLVREEEYLLTPISVPKLGLGKSRFSIGSERNLFGSVSPSQTTSPMGFSGTPVRFSGSPMGLMAIASSRNIDLRRVGFGNNNRLGSSRISSSVGSENISPMGSERRSRGGVKKSILPSWYPRSPLRDITAIVNAIERKRNRLKEAEQHRLASVLPQELSVQDSTLPAAGAPLEHNFSLTYSDIPTASSKASQPTAVHCPKMISLENVALGDSNYLTPQKKLLNAIDEVEKVVMKEFQRIRKTPIAKKIERENKVRKLMAMR
ncbi:hypothetical protein MKW94_016317 [Papaver nudicaule]|uniref:Uncharacterized protein n=1 Tax=Papaver nudicaule TaxID=74823 RepID=A0AA41V1R9_PAPNU|nr:hypothetical protein [Papaver nudicaule]